MILARWDAAEERRAVLRLRPGADLRGGIEDAFAAEGAGFGHVAACVGSLSAAAIRPAGRDDALTLEGDMEIVALSGTLTPDGPHLHVAVSDAEGRATGGHLLPGCTVRTTAEIVLALAPARLTRANDPATGYAELARPPAGP